ALGRSYFKMREWQKAIDSFRRAASLNTKAREQHEELHKSLVARNSEASNQQTPPVVAKTEPRDVPTKLKVTKSEAPMTAPSAQADALASASKTQPTTTRVSNASAPKTAGSVGATSIAPIEELSLTKIYRIGPNDVLDVRLNESAEPAKSTLFTITPSGL